MKRFYENNSYPHGITFHHFHDDKKHKKSQGSIDATSFKKIIKFVGLKNLNNPKIFLKKLENGKLKKNDLCLTFDDGSKTQIDIALEVMNEFKLKGFFFIPSNIFSEKPDYLEVYRYFRNNCYRNIDDFYLDFFSSIVKDYKNFLVKNDNKIKKKLKKFHFFSYNDVKFRLLRDNFLSKKEYDSIMKKLFKKKKFSPHIHKSKLFLSKKDLLSLKKEGHTIGLHTHSHPTKIDLMNKNLQYKEYFTNRQILSDLLGVPKEDLNSMAHPCGNYNKDTLNILEHMKIKIGFSNQMLIRKKQKLETLFKRRLVIPRNDHSLILKLMN